MKKIVLGNSLSFQLFLHSLSKLGRKDGVIKTFEEHEDSVYSISWATSPWIFASLSYEVYRIGSELMDCRDEWSLIMFQLNILMLFYWMTNFVQIIEIKQEKILFIFPETRDSSKAATCLFDFSLLRCYLDCSGEF